MLSIIVPIYNSEQFLPKTLDSLLAQSCKDFEVVLVDDGSTDDSLAICQEFASKDSRFKVFHQENSGVSAARNLGVLKASSEIITFLDSDDYVSEDYCEVILREMGDCDLLAFQTEKHHPDGSSDIIKTKPGYYDGRPNVEEGLYYIHSARNDQFGWPTNKAFRRSIILENEILFPLEYSWHEDEVFMLRYARCVEKFKIIDNVLYHYQMRGDSLSYSNITAAKIDVVTDAMRKELETYSNPSFVRGFQRQIFFFYYISALKESVLKKRIQCFLKARDYYRRNINNMADKGRIGNFIFKSPAFVGCVMFLAFGNLV